MNETVFSGCIDKVSVTSESIREKSEILLRGSPPEKEMHATRTQKNKARCKTRIPPYKITRLKLLALEHLVWELVDDVGGHVSTTAPGIIKAVAQELSTNPEIL